MVIIVRIIDGITEEEFIKCFHDALCTAEKYTPQGSYKIEADNALSFYQAGKNVTKLILGKIKNAGNH